MMAARGGEMRGADGAKPVLTATPRQQRRVSAPYVTT